MRTTLAATLAALALLSGTATAEDTPCQTADHNYEVVTGAYGGFCDFEHDAQYTQYAAGFSLVCDQVNGTAMTSSPAYESGSATCQTFGASDDFEVVIWAVGDPATFRYWSVAPGTLERSEGWFRIEIPRLQGLYMQGNYVRTYSQWVLQGVIVHNPPGHVLRAAAFGGPGVGLPNAPTYPFAMTGTAVIP